MSDDIGIFIGGQAMGGDNILALGGHEGLMPKLPDMRKCGELCRGVEQAAEKQRPVLAAQALIDRALRMGHQSKDIPALIGDTGDVTGRPVDVFNVPKQHLPLALKAIEHLLIRLVISIVMGDGEADIGTRAKAAAER